ncbi:MAG TPA: glutamate ABC transporter substrate-binding protein [Amycolatopsis sp.]|uniref:glutamate ABC transporter substrate-binding protein n=1 Tax=Amycolatopsis sp. TaxID=37632 RepID=UPI002B494997|nr:glutamate ABC transporter substrate-binding protein [Amycolatopsis sp.]HKS45075.1 glutamate ABC transporter substrate-binding protein [Amycolatopsis sp.]
MIRRSSLGTLLAAVALLAVGCGSVRTPVDPAPVHDVREPAPASVGGADTSGGGSSSPDCDTRSLSPSSGISAGSTMATIKQRGRLVVGVDQTTYLFGFLNPATGEFEGFDIDIVKQIASALFGDWHNHVQFKAIPSSARESMLSSGQVDVVVRTYSITCDRLKKVNFSSVYYQAGQRVLVEKNSGFTGLNDLRGKKVCAAKASTSLKTLSQSPMRPVPVSVNNWSDCLVMLQQGQVDAVSTDDVILAGMARQDPNLEVVGDRFTQENYGVGIPKGHEDMVRYVNYVLDNVRNGSAWRESYNTWLLSQLGPASPPPVSYQS